MKIKRLLKKKAFTLIEMIVAMSIMVILVGAAMAMFNPVKSVISSLGNDMVTDNVTDTITNYLSDKLKTATTYNIAGYTTDNLKKNSDDSNGVTNRINLMMGDMDTGETMCFIMLRATSKGYKLYDFGKITNANNYLTKMNDALSSSEYAVFEDEFYNDSRYKFTFATTSSNRGTWCRMGVNTYDQDGEIKVSERVQTFKLLNMSLLKITPSSEAELENYDYSDNLNIVILYRIKVYG